MPDYSKFNELLEAVDHLPFEDQETLIDILNHRLPAIKRAEIVGDAAAAQEEYSRNQYRVATSDELTKEILR